MAKKQHKTASPSGWPRGGQHSAGEAKLAAVQRLAADFARGAIRDADFERYLLRLGQMMHDWPEFEHTRFELPNFQRALRSLPEDEFKAMLNPQLGARRSRRARAQLLREAFDDELVGLLASAIGDAAERAGSPDDVGALGLALSSLRAYANGATPIESNPLLAILLELAFDEFGALTQALKEADAFEKKEGEAPPADDAERQRQRQEMLLKHPAVQRDVDHRTFRLSHRLLEYLRLGIIRAHLTDEQLAPLVASAALLAQQAPRGAESSEASPPDLLARARAFAADPANDGLFKGFVEALAAESQEATEKAHPLAERLAAVAGFCHLSSEPTSPIRVLICQGSLARMARERAVARQAAAQEKPSA